MKRFTVNQFRPRKGTNIWEACVLKDVQILFFTQDVIDAMKWKVDPTFPTYGFDLFAYCTEDEWREYNRKFVTVKVIDLTKYDGPNDLEVPADYDESLRLFVVKNRMGMPLAIVYKDMDCWYWQENDIIK